MKKAARRSLYRLASQGIKPEKVAETTTATVGSRAATIYRVIASAYDGSGSRAIWFGAERPLGGIYLIAVMLNDLEGLVDVTVRDTTRKRFAELEESRRAQDPTAWVELPHDYAKQLVQEAASVSREAHRPIPPAFVMWSDVIDNPDEPFGQALIYREISAIEVRLHPTLVDESPRLFEQPEIEPWFDPPSATRRWVRQLTESTATRLILTPESPQDRQERIIREAAKELYPPKVLKGLRRRLEETAYIFQRTGREVEARRAVAAAVTIEDLRPLQPLHPFIRALAVRSLMIGVEVERSGAEPARLALAP